MRGRYSCILFVECAESNEHTWRVVCVTQNWLQLRRKYLSVFRKYAESIYWLECAKNSPCYCLFKRLILMKDKPVITFIKYQVSYPPNPTAPDPTADKPSPILVNIFFILTQNKSSLFPYNSTHELTSDPPLWLSYLEVPVRAGDCRMWGLCLRHPCLRDQVHHSQGQHA